MPYPTNVYRFNIVADTPGEQIVNTLWMRHDQAPIASDAEVVDTLTRRVRDHWTRVITSQTGDAPGIATLFANTTSWSRVSGYKVNALGKAVAQAEAGFSPALTGGAIGTLPPQLALVVTLLTNTPGRSGRGRIYLGGLAQARVNEQGRLTPADRDRVALAMGDFYKRLRDAAGQGDLYRPVVVSPTLSTSHKITRVSVGDVFDTQRSRRKSLKESRSFAVVDAS